MLLGAMLQHLKVLKQNMKKKRALRPVDQALPTFGAGGPDQLRCEFLYWYDRCYKGASPAPNPRLSSDACRDLESEFACRSSKKGATGHQGVAVPPQQQMLQQTPGAMLQAFMEMYGAQMRGQSGPSIQFLGQQPGKPSGSSSPPTGAMQPLVLTGPRPWPHGGDAEPVAPLALPPAPPLVTAPSTPTSSGALMSPTLAPLRPLMSMESLPSTQCEQPQLALPAPEVVAPSREVPGPSITGAEAASTDALPSSKMAVNFQAMLLKAKADTKAEEQAAAEEALAEGEGMQGKSPLRIVKKSGVASSPHKVFPVRKPKAPLRRRSPWRRQRQAPARRKGHSQRRPPRTCQRAGRCASAIARSSTAPSTPRARQITTTRAPPDNASALGQRRSRRWSPRQRSPRSAGRRRQRQRRCEDCPFLATMRVEDGPTCMLLPMRPGSCAAHRLAAVTA